MRIDSTPRSSPFDVWIWHMDCSVTFQHIFAMEGQPAAGMIALKFSVAMAEPMSLQVILAFELTFTDMAYVLG